MLLLSLLIVDDKELFKRLKIGEPHDFKELVEIHQKKVINTTYQFVHNKEDAEDLAQEVFIEVHDSISRFRADAKLSTWIYRIAINKSLDFIRKKKRKKRFAPIISIFGYDNSEELQNVPADVNLEKEFEEKEYKEILQAAVDKLPKNQKIVIMMSKYEELSNKEIASIMDFSLSAVEALLHRAKKNLRKHLHRYFEKRL